MKVNLDHVDTEKTNERSENFSSMSIKEAVELMNQEDLFAVKCIESQYDKITQTIEYVSEALANGNRLIYIGAGTSGRLGVLDAAECPPTFGVVYDTVIGIMAGGENAFIHAEEGAEDHKEYGAEDLKKINFQPGDVVVGIAASGRTPYVIGALEYAKSIGSKAIALVCTKNSPMKEVADITIEAVPGPEVLTGSTRLKAGTATKLILNMISTISMKEVGKIYKNYMVDLKLTNKKLQQRGVNILIDVTNIEEDEAQKVLNEANGHVKAAIVMTRLNINYDEAVEKLSQYNDNIDEVFKNEVN